VISVRIIKSGIEANAHLTINTIIDKKGILISFIITSLAGLKAGLVSFWITYLTLFLKSKPYLGIS